VEELETITCSHYTRRVTYSKLDEGMVPESVSNQYVFPSHLRGQPPWKHIYKILVVCVLHVNIPCNDHSQVHCNQCNIFSKHFS